MIEAYRIFIARLELRNKWINDFKCGRYKNNQGYKQMDIPSVRETGIGE